jgi:tripartite ATP-independent transporter DctP family solute receptor
MRQPGDLTRRSFVFGGAAASFTIWSQSLRAADFTFTQYHNQTEGSSLHQRLLEMWRAIGKETGGRVEARVFPENNKLAGSDPAALQMLVAGEIQFFTLMGGILGNVVPVAEVQQVPFAFRSAAAAHRAVDGPLGAYLRQEIAAKGLRAFPVGAFDNGMRHIGGTKRPIVKPADLVGLTMRVPAGKMFEDMFRTLGSEPVTVNSSGIYAALRDGTVDAQENPLAYMESFKHYEVMKYLSITNHMWSGFNMLAHLPTWNRIPADIQAVVERNVTTYVRLQRKDQEAANAAARTALAGHGLVVNEVDMAPFRASMSSVYARWKTTFGTRCWSLLEAESGRLA